MDGLRPIGGIYPPHNNQAPAGAVSAMGAGANMLPTGLALPQPLTQDTYSSSAIVIESPPSVESPPALTPGSSQGQHNPFKKDPIKEAVREKMSLKPASWGATPLIGFANLSYEENSWLAKYLTDGGVLTRLTNCIKDCLQ